MKPQVDKARILSDKPARFSVNILPPSNCRIIRAEGVYSHCRAGKGLSQTAFGQLSTIRCNHT